MKKIILIISITLISSLVWGQASASDTVQTDGIQISENLVPQSYNITKEAGDSAYLCNDFQEAIQIYESLLKQGEAAEIYYNLGNSYYKVDDIAHAILNYERALLLAPGNGDIRANLEIARSKTIDKVTPLPEVFFVSWFKALINCLSIDMWAKLGITFFLLCLICIGLFLVSKSVVRKKIGFIGSIVLLIFVVLSNVFAIQQKKALMERTQAIVLKPSVTVRSTPNETGTSLFILHEGHKVKIKDNTMREWKEIQLEDGKVGWLPASTIEII